ncbi:MAG TPA: DUF1549 and DUF1553 domain-containing protein [Methylomirabilota bacterium]|nr:DUF1549 and DUF1553 domain-containing protein [Methylomirabilota bacterium]
MLGFLGKLSSRVVSAALTLLTVCAAQAEVSFRNEVMAVLSKAGCNAGACHGNANGKASFKTSLRGEDPAGDYAVLTQDQFARRVDVFAPDESLLLLKGAAQIAHEGGQRFKADSWEYKLLRQWIAEGAREDVSTAPRVVELTVAPAEQYVLQPQRIVQIQAQARFSDGATRDVTAQAVYESDKPQLKISPTGLVEVDEPIEATVLVRFLDVQKPVRLAFIPNKSFTWKAPKSRNFIDEQIFGKLKRLRMNPSELCSDEVFVRRVHLDLLGILPTAHEAQSFVADRSRRKRERLVDTLLTRAEHADFWALKWADLLRIEERLLDQKGVHAFHRWIRDSFATNKPLDQFAREIVAARGSSYENPAANFYRAVRTPAARAEGAAQVFLGVRLQCAQCHNHPFDRWTQDDYYDWSSIFAKVDYKVIENRRRDDNDSHEFKGDQIIYVNESGTLRNARTGGEALPRFLGDSGMAKGSGDADILEQLGSWLTSPENPFFAKVQVNRIWFHLMGRGLVEPIDDFRPTNPASHPELLEQLAAEFVRSGHDMRHLIRLITSSAAYQLSSEPNDTNLSDESNFARSQLRRLTAEQLLDSQSQVTGASLKLNGLPEGFRAAESPGALAETRGRQKRNDADQVLAVFGKPPRLLTCECERSTDTTMSQAFQMISGPLINELIARPENRLAALAKSSRPEKDIVSELYWSALTRAPSASELAAAEAALAQAPDKRTALEDLTWSLLNAKEFIFRR